TVTVYPVSDVIINEITDDSNGSGAGSIDIAPVGDSGPYTFEWEKDGAFFAATEDLSNLNTGTYTLVMTDANGCTVQLSPVFIDNLVGTEGPASVEGKIKLWPNPARNIIRLEMTHFEPVAMEILNAQGQLVRVLQSDEWNSEIPVDALPVGFYYLKMVSRRGACHVEKWVKGE
ncbi:MAG: T9SS type A sorting domain-containing protein, partial [Saprospiraceae bacterium]|nr:T9SS type A sorting domain-containing protein [Saprospiraceae bacterium]